MRDAVHYGVLKAEELRRTNGKMPLPIDLRREIKQWFDSTYDHTKHHVNPLDSELVKLQDGFIRITFQPHEYEYIPVNSNHSKYSEYSQYGVSELLLRDRKVVLSGSPIRRRSGKGRSALMSTTPP